MKGSVLKLHHEIDVFRTIPLSAAVFSILLALAGSEKHGYAIMQSVSGISENQFRMGQALSTRQSRGCWIWN